jgi:hypothetical protein
MSVRARRIGSLVAVGWLAAVLGCAADTQFVQVQQQPNQPLAISKVAVVPFLRVTHPGAPTPPDDAPDLVGGYIAEAFGARGLEVVTPPDVGAALGLEGSPAAPLDPQAVARAVADRFGADAVVMGSVYRFRERAGQAMGTTQPASAGFEVRLYAAPSGRLLWSGTFDDTQVALSANLLRSPQYPGGGTRWLTVEELARFGAGRVAQAVPLAGAAKSK